MDACTTYLNYCQCILSLGMIREPKKYYGESLSIMSIVAAKRVGKRIVVLSDTMISDPNSTADNILPGRLKSVVLSRTLTVSYAGLSFQAIDAIRALHRRLPTSVHSTLQFLTDTSKRFNGEIDFLVCSHDESAQLFKISRGNISVGSDFYWIGNAQAVSELSQIEVQQPKTEDMPDYYSEEEAHFTNRFHTYLREGRCPGVGGVVINCLCSEYGHCYQDHANAFSWDTILLGQDDFDKRQAANRTGMYHFEYNVCSPEERGHAVVGIFLGQSNVGFIHEPLRRDDAEKITGINHTEFANLVRSYGRGH